jgi:hypothetical protein
VAVVLERLERLELVDAELPPDEDPVDAVPSSEFSSKLCAVLASRVLLPGLLVSCAVLLPLLLLLLPVSTHST